MSFDIGIQWSANWIQALYYYYYKFHDIHCGCEWVRGAHRLLAVWHRISIIGMHNTHLKSWNMAKLNFHRILIKKTCIHIHITHTQMTPAPSPSYRQRPHWTAAQLDIASLLQLKFIQMFFSVSPLHAFFIVIAVQHRRQRRRTSNVPANAGNGTETGKLTTLLLFSLHIRMN